MLNELMSFLPEDDKSTPRDMFPGIDPSAFEEHQTYKKAIPQVNKIKRQITRYESLAQTASAHELKLRKVFQAGVTWGSQDPNKQALTEMPWIDKYPLTKERLGNTTVATDSPKFNKLERIISSYEATLEQQTRYDANIKRLKSKLLRVRKQEAERNIKDKATSVSKVNIDVNNIPHTFNITYRTEQWPTPKQESFDNPYFLQNAGQTAYAGHPAHFTEWKGKLRTMFYELENWVKDLGHPELDMMYASITNKGRPAELTRYYLTNKDGSVIVVNDRYNKIYIHARAPNLPADSLPVRWRMRQLRAKDLDWLAIKLKTIKP